MVWVRWLVAIYKTRGRGTGIGNQKLYRLSDVLLARDRDWK